MYIAAATTCEVLRPCTQFFDCASLYSRLDPCVTGAHLDDVGRQVQPARDLGDQAESLGELELLHVAARDASDWSAETTRLDARVLSVPVAELAHHGPLVEVELVSAGLRSRRSVGLP